VQAVIKTPTTASAVAIGRNAMKIPRDDTTRMLEEVCPGSPDLESALANESVGNAASHPAPLVDVCVTDHYPLGLVDISYQGGELTAPSTIAVPSF
jgi:hypothetical protein